MSRGLVGSSRRSMCGLRSDMRQKTRRARKPGDMVLIGSVCFSPVTPKSPSLGRHASTSIFRVLVIAADAEVGVAANIAFSRHNLLLHELEKGGLACAVGTHEGNAGVAVDADLEARVQ